MIDRILEQERAIRQVLSNDRKSVHLIPSWQDIEVLESIKSALGPLHSFTDLLSGEKHVTISAIMPLLHHLYSDILLSKEDDTRLAKDIKTRVKVYMEQKYSDEENILFLNIASYLDPRFKSQYMNEASKDAVQEKLILDGKLVTAQCRPLSDSNQPSTSTDTSVSSLPTPPSSAPVPQKKMKLSDVFRSKVQSTTSLSAEDEIKGELDSYLRHPTIDVDKNPLEWWKIQSTSFPILGGLARKYLCVCATSSSSERAFNTAGYLLSPKRTCVNPDKMNMMAFLSKNL